jgi:hypothetical protein
LAKVVKVKAGRSAPAAKREAASDTMADAKRRKQEAAPSGGIAEENDAAASLAGLLGINETLLWCFSPQPDAHHACVL